MAKPSAMQTATATSKPGSDDHDAGQIHPAGQQRIHHRQRDHGADHHHFAVGEVDQLEDAVHHGVAQRDQGVDAAQHQAVDELLEKNIQGRLLGRRGAAHRLQHFPLAVLHLIQGDGAILDVALVVEADLAVTPVMADLASSGRYFAGSAEPAFCMAAIMTLTAS